MNMTITGSNAASNLPTLEQAGLRDQIKRLIISQRINEIPQLAQRGEVNFRKIIEKRISPEEIIKYAQQIADSINSREEETSKNRGATANLTQEVNNYLIGQRINEGKFAGIVKEPISLEEIITNTQGIKNIINPPKQEPLRQDGNNLARNVDLF
jgi:hypothetical protein